MMVTVKVIPRSSRNEVIPLENGALKVKLTAPPVDGGANQSLIQILAEHYQVKKSAIRIVRGATSRTKIIDIA